MFASTSVKYFVIFYCIVAVSSDMCIVPAINNIQGSSAPICESSKVFSLGNILDMDGVNYTFQLMHQSDADFSDVFCSGLTIQGYLPVGTEKVYGIHRRDLWVQIGSPSIHANTVTLPFDWPDEKSLDRIGMKFVRNLQSGFVPAIRCYSTTLTVIHFNVTSM